MGSCFSRGIRMHTDDEDRDAVFYAGNRVESCVVGPGLDENSPCVMHELDDITTEEKFG